MKDFHLLKEKTVGIVGSGSSAFDAAAVALEMGAFKVEMLMRRSTLAKFNRLAFFHQQCLGFGYYYMDPAWKWEIMKEALSDSIAPPVDSLKRVSLFSNFELISSVSILDSRLDENLLIINTNQGEKRYDFLILATGYQVDGYAQKELSNVMDHIFLWRDCQLGLDEKENILGLYPYLGDWFQFTEKFPGEAPYLKDVHCFNHASTLSHGIICRNIPLMSIGAERLAKGIVVDFLKRQETFYLNSWHELKEDFEPTDYF